MSRTNGGINKEARLKILSYINRKLANKINLINRDGKEYTTLTIKELSEHLEWKNKPAISKILRYMESNGIIYKIDTNEKIRFCRHTLKAYRICSNIADKDVKDITTQELYPTRNYNANKVLQIFLEETHQPRIKANRRTFIRIGKIMKDIFKWDLNKFRCWCKWIYTHGRKNTYRLLRSSKATAIFVLERFQNIWRRYEKDFSKHIKRFIVHTE